MSDYTIQLDGCPGSPNKKFTCPGCGHKQRFRRYWLKLEGRYIADECGICDRYSACGYHLPPREHFANNPHQRPIQTNTARYEAPVVQMVHFPVEAVKATLRGYSVNSFVQALRPYFPLDKICKVVGDYYLGTVQAFQEETPDNLSTVFWFIDREGNIRAGQVKLFGPDGKTMPVQLGENTVKAWWMHRVMKRNYRKAGGNIPQWLQQYEQQDKKVTCLFGEHLLNEPENLNKPVALVEAPKSAIIGALMYEGFVWCATSSLSYFTRDRIQALKGRKVICFPDAGHPNPKTGRTPTQEWKLRAADFGDIGDFQFMQLFEEGTTEGQREDGLDVADLILSELRAKPLEIQVENIKAMPVRTVDRSGDFGFLIVQTIWLKDGRVADVLFDQYEEPILTHPSIDTLARHFKKTFRPGKIDGVECLIHLENYSHSN